ncbi:MAG: hypothetical protein MUO21_06245, partial [Nitrososphaeraceae archaeon]|nr:hypothetical protein [Nitrososphaeraceae archaeon]
QDHLFLDLHLLWILVYVLSNVIHNHQCLCIPLDLGKLSFHVPHISTYFLLVKDNIVHIIE